jgi:hypothetical protein
MRHMMTHVNTGKNKKKEYLMKIFERKKCAVLKVSLVSIFTFFKSFVTQPYLSSTLHNRYLILTNSAANRRF